MHNHYIFKHLHVVIAVHLRKRNVDVTVTFVAYFIIRGWEEILIKLFHEKNVFIRSITRLGK